MQSGMWSDQKAGRKVLWCWTRIKPYAVRFWQQKSLFCPTEKINEFNKIVRYHFWRNVYTALLIVTMQENDRTYRDGNLWAGTAIPWQHSMHLTAEQLPCVPPMCLRGVAVNIIGPLVQMREKPHVYHILLYKKLPLQTGAYGSDKKCLTAAINYVIMIAVLSCTKDWGDHQPFSLSTEV